MKTDRSILGLVILFAASPAMAGLSFGLGNAVAKRSAELINKAAANTLPPPLPSCGSQTALFTQAPVNDPTLVAVNPIGHSFPPGHTFPADHAYFSFNASSTALLGINTYAPSDGWVVQTTALYYSRNAPASYSITFSPCAEVKLDNLSVYTIAPALTHPTGFWSTACSSDNQGTPGVIQSCVTTMEVPVKAGQLLGTGGVVDFGPIEDTRSQISGFANPSRHDIHRGLCPLNYFVPGVQAFYAAMLGGWNGTFIPRTLQPLCGTIMQDVPGTAQGDWYDPGAPDIPDNPHLSLMHFNIDPSTASFSVGTSIPNFGGTHDFIPKTTPDGTRIDYDFKLVNDTQLYCYDSLLIEFVSNVGGPDPQYAGQIVLLQLSGTSLDTLTIELQNPGTTCLNAPHWAFTSAAVTFQR